VYSFQRTADIDIAPDAVPLSELQSAEAPSIAVANGTSSTSGPEDSVAASLGVPAWLLTALAPRIAMLLQCTETQGPQTRPRHIQFLGLTPGAGASTVAAAYAHAAITLRNRSVLLLRANYASVGPGILECVSKKLSINGALRVVHSHLSVGDLLDHGGTWQRGLDTLFADPSQWSAIGQGFDEVIVEYQYSEASRLGILLAPQASGVVLVVDADRTPRATAMAAYTELASVRAQVLGTVLNRCAAAPRAE
jgi:Mrp family chromosome partitioning ATPase